jgi:uncharacterized protein YfbU (UPF0304 family)
VPRELIRAITGHELDTIDEVLKCYAAVTVDQGASALSIRLDYETSIGPLDLVSLLYGHVTVYTVVSPYKRGEMVPKSERFELRIEADLIARLDAWRSGEDDQPSRAEAVRRLVEAGLRTDNRRGAPMLTDGERLITAMVADIATHLKVKGETDVGFVQKALYGGHNWALGWEMPGLFHSHVDSPVRVTFVVDVLDMWSFLEEAMARMSAKEKKRIEMEAEPFGKFVEYRGFDGNNESEYLNIAAFLIDEMDRFAIFKGRGRTNSHMPTVETYRRMLDVFEPTRKTVVGRRLTPDEVIAVMKAMAYPSQRAS